MSGKWTSRGLSSKDARRVDQISKFTKEAHGCVQPSQLRRETNSSQLERFLRSSDEQYHLSFADRYASACCVLYSYLTHFTSCRSHSKPGKQLGNMLGNPNSTSHLGQCHEHNFCLIPRCKDSTTRLGFTPTLERQYLPLPVSCIVHTCQLTMLNGPTKILHKLQCAQKAGTKYSRCKYSKKTLYLQDFWLSLSLS